MLKNAKKAMLAAWKKHEEGSSQNDKHFYTHFFAYYNQGDTGQIYFGNHVDVKGRKPFVGAKEQNIFRTTNWVGFIYDKIG